MPGPHPEGRLPRPGWLGRLFRVALGLVLLVWLGWGLAAFFALPTGWPLPLLLALPLVLYFQGDVFRIGFARDWGRRPLLAAVLLLALAVAADLLLTGTLGAAPSRWLLLLICGGGLLYGGLAYLLAAVVAAPG